MPEGSRTKLKKKEVVVEEEDGRCEVEGSGLEENHFPGRWRPTMEEYSGKIPETFHPVLIFYLTLDRQVT